MQMSVAILSHDPILHARTKHVGFNIHFVHERFMVGKLHIQHVSAPIQIADIFTKPHSSALFDNFCDKLKIACVKAS